MAQVVNSGSYNGSAYLVITADSWTAAQAEAVSLGGNLVTIDDAAENAYVQGLLQATPGMTNPGAWIGYTDQNVEGQFEWVDGSNSNYTNWFSGWTPGNGEDYVQMYNQSNLLGLWNDISETHPARPQFAVVEIPQVPVVDLNGEDGTGIDFSNSFVEDGGAVQVTDADVTVTAAEIVSATATVTNLLDGADETLAVNTAGTDITASYDSATGVLTLTGTAAPSDYETVLQTLTYNNSSQSPTESDRSIEIAVNDGTVDSTVAISTISVSGVNDAPTSTAFFPAFGNDFQVNTGTQGTQRNQSMAALADGGFVITYQSDVDGRWDVYAQRYDSTGNAVGSEFLVNSEIAADQLAASVSALQDGGFIIAWQSQYQDGSNDGIFAQRFNAAGEKVDASGANPGGEFQVNTTTFDSQTFPVVEGLNDGGFVVVYQSVDSFNTFDILARRYDANGTPQGNDFRVNATNAFWQQEPSVAALPDGKFIVVWHNAHQVTDVFGQRFNADGSPDGPEFTVNTTTAGEQRYPDVTTLSDGGYLVTWSSWAQDGSLYGVYGQRFNADGSQHGSEFLINTVTEGDQRWSSATALQDGGFLVTWADQSGDVYAQRFDDQGAKVDAPFVIHAYTEGGQVGRIHGSDSGAVALLANGNLAFTWGGQSATDDNGISARILSVGQTSSDGELVSLDVSGNFSDIDGTIESYSATGLPEGLSINNSGLISGTIDPNASDQEDDNNGTQDYTVTVTATDDDGATTSQTFTYQVDNVPPDAVDDSYSVDEDNTLTGVNVLAGTGIDSDGSPDSDTLTVTGNSTPANGTVTISNTGDLTYTSNANFNGSDTFTYTISDGNGGTDTATVTVTVNDINDDPISTTIDPQTSTDGETVTLDVSGNFSDVDGTIASYSVSGLPDGLTIDSSGAISGTIDPNASDAADDNDGTQDYSVTVTATDNDGATTAQTFTYTVNNVAPDAVDDSFITDEDTPLTGVNVLAGTGADSDGAPDSDSLTVISNTPATNGTATIASNGDLTYTPNPNFNGSDTVSYTISDGNGGNDSATVTITVNDVNDAPTGTVYKVIDADSWTAAQEEAVSLGGNLVTIDDAAENAYVLSLIQDTEGMTASGAWIGYTDQDEEGTFEWIDSSSTGYENWATGEPNNNGNGAPEHFAQMFAEDLTRGVTAISAGQWNDLPDTGLSDTPLDAEQVNPQFAVVEITNPIAICGTLEEDSLLTAKIGSLVDADGLPESSTFSYQWEQSIDGGTTWTVITGATNETFTPGDAQAGQQVRVNMTYTDLQGTTETVTSAGVTIANVNDAPTLVSPPPIVITEDSAPSELDLSTLGDDADAEDDGDSLNYLLAGVSNSHAGIAIKDGILTFDPGDYFQSLAVGESKDVFASIHALDSQGTFSPFAAVTFTVNGVNDAAVITGDSIGTAQEEGVNVASTTATGDLDHTDADDSEIDDVWQAVTTETDSDEGYGTFVINTAGQWTYTVDQLDAAVQALGNGDTLIDTFTVSTEDGTEQTISVTIGGANDDAIISGSTNGSVTEDAPISSVSGSLSVTDIDSDENFNPQTSDGTYGGFSIGAEGEWTYILDNEKAETNALSEGQSVTDTFIVTTADGTSETVTIAINGSNEVTTPTFTSSIDPGTLDGSNGFVIHGIAVDDFLNAPSNAGDINGDGVDDLVLGAAGADPNGPNSGQSYVVFGNSNGFASTFELSTLNGSNGFFINGISAEDVSGVAVSNAGDVNGDGIDDLVIGTDRAGSFSGESYVVFGNSNGFASTVELSGLNGSNGFRLKGGAGDRAGISVSNAGDVNGDGVDDLVIGAFGASPNGKSAAGRSYVVFGNSNGFASSTLELSNLNSSEGFVINGISNNHNSGLSVSNAGDVNGDGIDDIIIGAQNAGNQGQSYVVFGNSSGGFASGVLELSALDGSNGFVINGGGTTVLTGSWVSNAGDVNGDGIDDVIIGGDPDFGALLETYVVFGNNSGGFSSGSLDLSTLNGSNGFIIDGIDPGDRTGRTASSAGDVNGDGIDDLLLSAEKADSSSGESYVVFGSSNGFTSRLALSGLDGSNGFIVSGRDAGDRSGNKLSNAGDVNGDGADDIIISAFGGDPNGRSNAGESYVIFGQGATSINNPAIIGGNTTGFVVEDQPEESFSDSLTVTDVDPGEDIFNAQTTDGTYGTFNIDTNGEWTYTLNNGDPDTNGLSQVQSVTDTFTVSTADGTSETVTIDIFGANDAPIVSIPALPSQVATFREAFSFDPSSFFSDVDTNDTLTFSVGEDSLPSWLEFDDITGTFSGTPEEGDTVGYHVIDITATDSFGESSSSPITLSVSPVNEIEGDSTNQTLNGTSNSENLLAKGGNDIVKGREGNDWLSGGNGNDILRGGPGDDVFWGGKGRDTLTGGLGADQFRVSETSTERDTITEFNTIENDIIVLDGLSFDDLVINPTSTGFTNIEYNSKVLMRIESLVGANSLSEENFLQIDL